MESSYDLNTNTHTHIVKNLIKYLFIVRAFIIFRFFTSRINISIFNHPSDINKINSEKWYFNGIADLLSIEKLFFTLITIFIVEQENQYEKQNNTTIKHTESTLQYNFLGIHSASTYQFWCKGLEFMW